MMLMNHIHAIFASIADARRGETDNNNNNNDNDHQTWTWSGRIVISYLTLSFTVINCVSHYYNMQNDLPDSKFAYQRDELYQTYEEWSSSNNNIDDGGDRVQTTATTNRLHVYLLINCIDLLGCIPSYGMTLGWIIYNVTTTGWDNKSTTTMTTTTANTTIATTSSTTSKGIKRNMTRITTLCYCLLSSIVLSDIVETTCQGYNCYLFQQHTKIPKGERDGRRRRSTTTTTTISSSSLFNTTTTVRFNDTIYLIGVIGNVLKWTLATILILILVIVSIYNRKYEEKDDNDTTQEMKKTTTTTATNVKKTN